MHNIGSQFKSKSPKHNTQKKTGSIALNKRNFVEIYRSKYSTLILWEKGSCVKI